MADKTYTDTVPIEVDCPLPACDMRYGWVALIGLRQVSSCMQPYVKVLFFNVQSITDTMVSQ